MAIKPPKKTASPSKEEVARGTAASQMRGEFERQLMAFPGAVARGEAQPAHVAPVAVLARVEVRREELVHA